MPHNFFQCIQYIVAHQEIKPCAFNRLPPGKPGGGKAGADKISSPLTSFFFPRPSPKIRNSDFLQKMFELHLKNTAIKNAAPLVVSGEAASYHGGEAGIRTLVGVTLTRFPIVPLRPARAPLRNLPTTCMIPTVCNLYPGPPAVKPASAGRRSFLRPGRLCAQSGTTVAIQQQTLLDLSLANPGRMD
jgi:hypothetical protein